MAEARRYLRNRRGIASEVRDMLKQPLRDAWSAGERVLLIGHSMGSVIAYDTLWELSHETRENGVVDLFVSMGSPLATRFMRERLCGAKDAGRERYPTIIRRWENFSAKGDRTPIHPELRPFFKEMLDLNLVESITDHIDFYNPYRGRFGLNVHMSYGYLVQPVLANVLADWLEEPDQLD